MFVSVEKGPDLFSFHFQGHLPYYRSRGLNQSINGVKVDPVDINIVTFYIDMNQRRILGTMKDKLLNLYLLSVITKN